MTQHIVVIGCGTAGAAATLRARKTDQQATITIIQDESLPEYSRCGLPYTVNKTIPSTEDVIIHPTAFYEGNLIRADLRLNTKAQSLNWKEKHIILKSKKGGEEELSYDALVLATGARPATPPIKGLDAPHVHRLHTLKDAKQLQEKAKKGKKVVIIGAGLVGLETAEALHSLGLEVTVVEFLDQVLPAMLDEEMAALVQAAMEAEGIDLKLSTAAKTVTTSQVLIADRATETETKIDAEIVVVATGVRANTRLAEEAGIKLGARKGIHVDNHMKTSAPDVYAAGDCAEHLDLVTGQTVVSGLGSVALRQGEVAGTNAAGGNAELSGVLLARTTHLFGLEVAGVGPTRVAAERANMPVLAGKFKGSRTAEYYPSEEEVTVKLLAHKETGRLLGGQAIGPCAHQRVNVLSTALSAKMTIRQVADLETCYAPPVAPIREPLTMAAQVLALRYERMEKKRQK
ncbi:MAG: FAD-dependent oxidoreductase [Candidatus Hermodarchaeota archaeon]|nr:FAD-dependent oxidoreductase [Candidatus Hermodarchaeota archaeon]